MIHKRTPETVRGSWAAWKEFHLIPTDLKDWRGADKLFGDMEKIIKQMEAA
jgi:hypothetical protein